jgi:XTP/dITP diphosphohydrolase
VLRYVTTNPGKVREAERYLPDGSVDRLDFDYTEIQADELGPIAARGAREAYRHAGEPVLVDDAGVAGMPGDAFGTARGDWIRFALVTPRAVEAAERLADYFGDGTPQSQ